MLDRNASGGGTSPAFGALPRRTSYRKRGDFGLPGPNPASPVGGPQKLALAGHRSDGFEYFNLVPGGGRLEGGLPVEEILRQGFKHGKGELSHALADDVLKYLV